jgi:hypothetical protein
MSSFSDKINSTESSSPATAVFTPDDSGRDSPPVATTDKDNGFSSLVEQLNSKWSKTYLPKGILVDPNDK